MRVTIKDVAKQACVSPATVSLVLNNAPGVSPTTRENVMRVMREINYKPDALARSFSSRRAQAVGLVMPSAHDSLNDPYFIGLLRGVLEAVRDRGYKMLLEIADDRFMEQRLWEDLFLRNQIDGMVVATPELHHDYLKELSTSEFRTLLVNGARPDIPELDFVGYDDERCGIDATYYLIGLGHRRIGHLMGPDTHASAHARLKGYKLALERARIPFRPEDVLAGDYKRESALAAMTQLLERPAADRPTAIFCANDTMALAAMQVARAAGMQIPGDMSFIGVDDNKASAAAIPPLTTMRQDIYSLACLSAGLFIKKLEDRSKEPIFERVPMTLVERSSCAPCEGGR